MNHKEFPLKYYLTDLWDGKNILVEEVVSDVQQIHASGDWPKEGTCVEDMVAMIKALAPEYALALNHRKHSKGQQLSNCANFDIHHWVLVVADPSHYQDMALMNELRVSQGLPVSCILMTSVPNEL